MNSKVMRAVFVGLGLTIGSLNGQTVFCGSSPCGEAIRQVLAIPTNGEPDIIEWKLTLHDSPARYELRCDYGSTAAGHPGLAKGRKTLERKGEWKKGKGIKSNPEAVAYDLTGALVFFEVDSNILQALNPDRSLMVGNGGWSYTLNRTDHSEKPPEEKLSQSQPSMSYEIARLATGPTVFGVFEGRTPCRGIARQLKIPVHAGSTKVKWRVTLYQNPETLAPTTYKVEGSLHRRGAREGEWTMTRGMQKDPKAVVYRLGATKTEPALLLLKGDDNVLFFMDQSQQPMVGHCGFSYTLNRRSEVMQTARAR